MASVAVTDEKDGDAPTAQQWSEMFDAMEKLHEMFKSLMIGGFTEDQALRIVAYVMLGKESPT